MTIFNQHSWKLWRNHMRCVNCGLVQKRVQGKRGVQLRFYWKGKRVPHYWHMAYPCPPAIADTKKANAWLKWIRKPMAQRYPQLNAKTGR